MKTAMLLLFLAGSGIPGMAQEKRTVTFPKAAARASSQSLAPTMLSYQAAIDRYTADRKTAAAALFRLAECYRKQGKASDAASAYARIVREFSDQTKLADQSRSHLPEYAKPAAPDLAALRKQYRAALETEVQVAQANLDYAQLQLQLGAYSPLETYPVQRALAEAKSRLAAWDAGLLKPEPPFPMRN